MGAGQAAAAAPRAKFALWSTGELSITFRDSPTITLDVASTSALCHYLDRLREAS